MQTFTEEEKVQYRTNRLLNTRQVVLAMPSEARIHAEIVGRWVWVQFDEKPSEEIIESLKALGFKWNRKRRVWQHPCGRFCKASPGDPKLKYRIYSPDQIATEEE